MRLRVVRALHFEFEHFELALIVEDPDQISFLLLFVLLFVCGAESLFLAHLSGVGDRHIHECLRLGAIVIGVGRTQLV